MKNIISILIIVITASLGVIEQGDLEPDSFTIYLVRHAEKDYDSSNKDDLPLTDCGEQRSKSLAVFLADINLKSVYSTDYARTRSTAAPTAEMKNLETQMYNAADHAGLVAEILAAQETVLVVAHSNTIPVIASMLTGENFSEIDLDVYDRIYQVVMCRNAASVNLFHSPFECDE
jgi:broad specificity phosphatase PhoE